MLSSQIVINFFFNLSIRAPTGFSVILVHQCVLISTARVSSLVQSMSSADILISLEYLGMALMEVSSQGLRSLLETFSLKGKKEAGMTHLNKAFVIERERAS